MLGDTLASFLPGVSITLCQVITGDTKQGQTVIIVSIYVRSGEDVDTIT